MNIITLTNQAIVFRGATLPLERTNTGQYYIKAISGEGPAVDIDLLLSKDAQVIPNAGPSFSADLLLMQAAVEQNVHGHYRLAKETPATACRDNLLIWIPNLKENIEVNVGQVRGGSSLIMEEVEGKCWRISTGGLVVMKRNSSFKLSTCRNQDHSRKDKVILSYLKVAYASDGKLTLNGTDPFDYTVKWG